MQHDEAPETANIALCAVGAAVCVAAGFALGLPKIHAEKATTFTSGTGIGSRASEIVGTGAIVNGVGAVLLGLGLACFLLTGVAHEVTKRTLGLAGTFLVLSSFASMVASDWIR